MDNIEKLINDILECRRYVKSDSEHVKQCILKIIVALGDVPDPRIDRLYLNLIVAHKYIQVDPDVASNYLYNTAFELRCIKP